MESGSFQLLYFSYCTLSLVVALGFLGHG